MAGSRPYNADWLKPEMWNEIYQRILVKTFDGKAGKEIARLVNNSPSFVYRVQKSNYFQERLKVLRDKSIKETTKVIVKNRVEQLTAGTIEEARKVIDKSALKAAKKMVDLMDNGGDKIAFAACKDILDRAGLKPIEVVETRERVYSPEEVAHARTILIETQSIVERLTTNPSPFILGDTRSGSLESSDTEQAHAGEPTELPTETGPGEPVSS